MSWGKSREQKEDQRIIESVRKGDFKTAVRKTATSTDRRIAESEKKQGRKSGRK